MKPYYIILARRCLIGCCALALGACGNKGPLTLPTATSQPAKQPLPTASPQQPADHSSPAAAKSQ